MKHTRQTNHIRIRKTHFLLFLLAVVLTVNLVLFSKIIRNTVPPARYPEPEQESGTPPQLPSEGRQLPREGFRYEEISCDNIHSGSLILINSKHGYLPVHSPAHEEPISLYSQKTSSYKIRDTRILLNPEAIPPLNQMLDDFKAETGLNSVMVVSAYRTEEEQQAILESKIEQLGEENARKTANEPGYSEHHSGYALDFTLYSDAGIASEYDGTGQYAWIAENCHNYGFILRYPDGKTDITGVLYEPWHFRYVGRAHALYIARNGLTLEEYIALLKRYPYYGESLRIQAEDGDAYEAYYVPVDRNDPKSVVPASDVSYNVSGNNIDGLIITIEKTGGADS